MGEKSDYIDELLLKLENSLRGSAMLLTMANDKMYTDEERLAKMEAIEELTYYVRDYYKNKNIIEQYKEFQENILDDGR